MLAALSPFYPPGACRMLVGADDAAIDIMLGPVHRSSCICLLLQGGQNPCPDASFLPTVEATGDGLPGAIVFRQIAPRGAGASEPEDAVHDEAMVVGRTARR